MTYSIATTAALKSARAWSGRAACALVLAVLCGSGLGLVRAAESETMAERSLRRIADRQKTLFAEAAKQGDKLDEEAFRTQVQSVAHDYELLLRNNPNFAVGYAAYGYLLGKVDMRKESAAMLLRANQLEPDIALVKNQLGNYMAEEGKPSGGTLSRLGTAFSTHPGTLERIELIQPLPAGTPLKPPISEDQWKDLKAICG